VASHPDVLKTVKPGVTKAVLNADVTPTGAFQTNRDMDLNPDGLKALIVEALGGGEAFMLPATRLAIALTGDSIATNFLMVGYAAQKGLLPIPLVAIEEAIRLNGANAVGNLRTLALGRLAAHAPESFGSADPAAEAAARLATLEDVIESRTRLLTDYQDGDYARRYLDFVRRTQARVAARSVEGAEEFVRTVAVTLGRLMAYKDEYEVARLHTDPAFRQALRAQFQGDYRLTFHLAPPLLSRPDPRTGRPAKLDFGGWIIAVFGLLRRLKGLRGTPFDIFGYSHERREERALVDEYRALIGDVADRIDSRNLQAAIAVARAAGEVRGYGPVKQASLAAYRATLPGLVAGLEPAARLVRVSALA
jgi:indolepyruvate ferredoxin oxidoreductase